jgi:hypothetical protein
MKSEMIELLIYGLYSKLSFIEAIVLTNLYIEIELISLKIPEGRLNSTRRSEY